MKIYFYCADNDKPSGGTKQTYRHVDILNELGFDAAVLHETPGFRLSWFDNATRIEYARDVSFQPDDIIAGPGTAGPAFPETAKGTAKVIFNRNCYRTFEDDGSEKNGISTLYKHEDVKGVITVSRDSREYLEFAFPGIEVKRVRPGIDPKLYYFNPDKKRSIAFMPRKNPHAAAQVVNILKNRGSLKDFELVPIEDMAEEDMARVLRESMIFLSFGVFEGFGLPAAEAMACGCVTIGHHGGGGREYFLPEFSYPVPQEDITGYVKTVENIMAEEVSDPDVMGRIGQAASAYIKENYSLERERKSVQEAWEAIIASIEKRR